MTKRKVGVENAYNMGQEAFNEGRDMMDCPASLLTETEVEMWEKGYQDALATPESIKDIDEDEGLYLDLESDEFRELNFH